jgi:hypothetical protein
LSPAGEPVQEVPVLGGSPTERLLHLPLVAEDAKAAWWLSGVVGSAHFLRCIVWISE